MLTVKLTKSSSSDPQDAGLEPVANPPCWGSETAVSLNLTIPAPITRAPVAGEQARRGVVLGPAIFLGLARFGVHDDDLKGGHGLLRRARRLVLAEGHCLEDEPLGSRVALDRVDEQSADECLRHRQGDRAISLPDGDQASGFLAHDLRQPIGRLRGCLGRGALWAAARIPGLAWGEAMRLGRVAVADGRVRPRAAAESPAHGATAWLPASAAPPASSRVASSVA